MFTNRIELRSYPIESCSHAHDFAQLVLPVSGSMELEVGHYSRVINNDVGVYIEPNERHCFAGSQKNLFLVIDVTDKSPLSSEIFKSNILNLSLSTKKLIEFTHQYLVEYKRDFFTESLINPLLLHLAANSFSPEPDLIVMKAKHWINSHFTDSVNLGRVARECCLSISQLQRRFKQALGCGMAEYWRIKKIQHAQSLLTQRNISIEAIAYKIGYENLSAFSRRFSQIVGMSPSQWRKKSVNCTENAAN
ncbi:MAG: helix-turn-helix transcriptional regulator [Tatlockia sp.]|nr:helix-turn-helix transcriptional regulator [Tatlockia sp.]